MGWGASSLGIVEKATSGRAAREFREGDNRLLRRVDRGGRCLREHSERAEKESGDEGSGDIHGYRVRTSPRRCVEENEW